ncbi:F-box only protein 21-like isoform X2 [Panulirus ornatus]|uniref:F-box only protein 21-like isoform X2 n=1 Tax=Panulirus ornatus TaxID=150431 RepID=UPI003A89331F
MEALGGCCGIGDLPDEVLLKILACHSLNVQDLCRVSATCWRLRNVVLTQNLWRLKLRQHWPRVWDQLPSNSGITDWFEEVLQIICFSRKVRRLVSGLSQRLYQNVHLTTPVYNEVDALVLSTTYAHFYVLDALRQIVEDGAQHPREPSEYEYEPSEQEQPRPVQPRPNWQYENLTEKYYALKVMSHVHQGVCTQEWEEFLSRPKSRQSLEIGAMLMARWFQPHEDVSIKKMISEIDGIAEECRNKLRVSHPDHPGLYAALITYDHILQESLWTPTRCKQLFKCINHVLFDQMKMAGNSEDYYCLKNSLINEVLSSKTGIPITLSIVYMAVCHRLGLFLEPVNYPSHFLMRWKIPGTDDYEYIDAFNQGRHLTGKELHGELPFGIGLDQMLLTSCDAMQVFQRMIRNIMNVAQMQAHISDHMELFCPATELMSLLTPADRSVQELLLRIYYTLEIHYDRIVIGCRRLLTQGPSSILEDMLIDCEQILKSQRDAPKLITPNKRSKEIVFATGLVMRHKKYNFLCVIFGWDKECKMPAEWVRRMGVHNLQYKTKQPFYNVLVYDGSHRYAAQENLEVAAQPKRVTHSDIGKYFQEFTGTHYIPNAELLQQYPEDEPVRKEILQVRGLL